MFHTVAYTTTIQSADGLKALPTVADTIFSPSGNAYLLPTDLKLLAAYAGSLAITKARINAPSLLRVGFPSIRPVQQVTAPAPSGTPTADPNLMTLLDSPIALRTGEPVGLDAATFTTSPAENAVGLLWFAEKLEPVPPGDSFWLRFTTTTTLSAALKWSVISPTFDQSFPSGTYAVIGLELTSPGAVAARVVFPGSIFRPGVVAQVGSLAAATVGAARTHQCFYDGSFGVFGTFQTSAPPSVEVFSVSADAAATIEGYLRVVRIGDVGALPPAPTGSPSPSLPAAMARR
ncbi:MAG: hypothetical protein ABL886_04730 [Rhodoglobus sp.]